MKKTGKRLMSLLLAAVLALSLCGTALAADTDLTAALYDENNNPITNNTIYVSDQDQTVKMSVTTEAEMWICALEFIPVVSDGLRVIGVENWDDDIEITSGDYNHTTFKVGWYEPINVDDVWTDDIGTIIVSVPANTPKGEYTITMSAITTGKTMGTIAIHENVSISATLYIEEANSNLETYVNINGTDVSYTEIEARMENIEETTKSFNSNEVTAKFLPVSALASAECAYTLAASDTSTTIAADEAYVYFDNGVLRSAKDGGTGKNWISGIESITSVNEHTYVDGVCTICGEADPDYVAAAYTVSLVPSATEVAPGETVDVDVVVTGGNFNAYDIEVTYDSALFSTTDNVAFAAYEQSCNSGDTIRTLTFTAQSGITETQTGAFGVSKALIGVAGEEEALDKDAESAATVGTSVTILVTEPTEYVVTFQDADRTTLGTVTVNEGEKVAIGDIPTTTAPAHYEFAGWDDGTGTSYTDAELAELEVTANVTYTATYAAEEYDVSFNASELNAPATATYGEDYEGTVRNYDSNYDYTVIAKFEDGTTEEYEVDTDGGFTIPGEDIVSDMTLTVTKTLSGVTAAVYTDYVAGYSLVVVHGGADGYAYDGNAMYRTAYYDGDTVDTADKAFAYIIEGTTSVNDVLNALTARNTAEEITASYDVNATGKVDINDAQAVADCYNVRGTLPAYMPVYLRADVNGDHVVNSTDADLVLNNRA